MRLIRRKTLGLLALALGQGSAFAGPLSANDWPTPPAPAGAQTTVIVPDAMINGKRSRVLLLESDLAPKSLAHHFRQQIGPRRVENTWRGDVLLGGLQGQHFQTIKISQTPSGSSRALIMLTQVPAPRAKSPALLDTERCLPSGSAVAATQESADGATKAHMVSAVNSASADANVDHLVTSLRQRGYSVTQRDRSPAGEPATQIVWMEGAGGAAWVSVVDLGLQRAVTVMRTRSPS